MVRTIRRIQMRWRVDAMRSGWLMGGAMLVVMVLLASCDPQPQGVTGIPDSPVTASPAALNGAAQPTTTPPGVRVTRTAAAAADEVKRVADFLAQPVETTASSAAHTATPVATALKTVADLRSSTTLTGTVNGALVNVRSGPGTNYATVGQVRADATIEITGRNAEGTWWRVCCPVDNAEGGAAESWIFAELVALVQGVENGADAMAAVPLAEIPPTPDAAPAVSASSRDDNRAAALAAAPAAGLPGAGGFGAPGATNPLTGLPLPGGRASQRPIIVCINNDFAARPQLGTANADVMYEYLMEGYGITRFSGIYYGEEAGSIGPMRSARLINYYMGALYDAGLACSGASDGVRYTLKHEAPFPYLDIDLDDPSNMRYSVSIGSNYRTRLRTSTAQLRTWLADWGVEKPAAVRSFTFGDVSGGGTAATAITIPYPSGSRSTYQYDAGSGRYLRSLGGAPHVDGNSGAQLALDNVVVQYVPHETTNIVEDSLGSLSIRLNLFGSGRAIVFRNGHAFDGTWRSDSRGDLPHFHKADGAEIPLKPGKTWISIVPLDYAIDYR